MIKTLPYLPPDMQEEDEQPMTNPPIGDPTLTPDAVIALGASQLRAPALRPLTPRQLQAQHLASEPCPPRSLDERRAPLALAPVALAELLELPGDEWPAVLPLVASVLELRELQLRRRLDALHARVQEHKSEPAGITSETVKAECRIELARALRAALDLRQARAELEVSGRLLRELLNGERCPTCLELSRPECRSGWTLPDRQNPMRLVECATRAQKNGREPLVHDRKDRRGSLLDDRKAP